MNIPDKVIDAACARYYEHAPIITAADARVAHSAAYKVIADWAVEEAKTVIGSAFPHDGDLALSDRERVAYIDGGHMAWLAVNELTFLAQGDAANG